MASLHLKRKRPLFSCVECRRRKVRCDRQDPCDRCLKAKIPCLYQDGSENGEVQQPLPPAKQCGLNYGAELASIPITSGRSSDGVPLHGRPLEGLDSQLEGHSRHGARTDSEHQPGVHLRKYHEDGLSHQHGRLRGTLSKARLLGTTHPMTTYRQCDELYPTGVHGDVVGRKESTKPALLSEVQSLIASSKRVARAIKKTQMSPFPALDEAIVSMPPRDVVDTLIEHYFRVAEGPFRILHIPSFRREYATFYDEPTGRRPVFTVILLLVVSIGVCVCRDVAIESPLRPRTRQWTQTAQSWLSNSMHKDRTTIFGLQAQCLLSLALQFQQLKPQAVWLAQGNLLRTAIYMGLHRDGRHFPKMPFFHAEMRRRLWSTILELEVQAMLDLGMAPLTGEQDFDTEPPLNIDDDEFDETTPEPPRSPAPSRWTHASLQILLRRSLKTRLQVVRLMNDSFSDPSYDDILRLTRALGPSLSDAGQDTTAPPTAFHRNLANYLTRRFLLALHRPFAAQALHNPRYYYSRKVCLDCALLLLSPEPDPDFNHMLLVTVTLFRHIMHYTAITLCMEIIVQIKEDQLEPELLRLHQGNRDRLLAVVRSVSPVTEKRLHMGETNVKSHVFLHMAIAQIEAMEQGLDLHEHVLTASKRSAEQALRILRSQSALGNGNMEETPGSAYTSVASSGLEDMFHPSFHEDGEVDLDFGDTLSSLFTGWADQFPL
ncbi:hypothetical protein BDV28DRAFT_64366 [Aspergillus coremiiformis]|uniref:Zn(2)-C6 fungal-type domain-containing protein n=1 Tax=Aspergillus coremiiformis TaxID=138285 RepID=A0A5N6YUX1_9EURO|nr:hypothetical protein BDV28DRAFT_64366 [Aspergillus coremiiformis]